MLLLDGFLGVLDKLRTPLPTAFTLIPTFLIGEDCGGASSLLLEVFLEDTERLRGLSELLDLRPRELTLRPVDGDLVFPRGIAYYSSSVIRHPPSSLLSPYCP